MMDREGQTIPNIQNDQSNFIQKNNSPPITFCFARTFGVWIESLNVEATSRR